MSLLISKPPYEARRGKVGSLQGLSWTLKGARTPQAAVNQCGRKGWRGLTSTPFYADNFLRTKAKSTGISPIEVDCFFKYVLNSRGIQSI